MSTSRGLLRSGSAATAAQLVRIFSLQIAHVVAGRFVTPAEWGIWFWLEPAFLLLATVRDLGVSNHVMRLKPMPFGTFLRVEVIWGGALGATVFAAAPWLAGALAGGGPEVAAGIRVLTAGLVLEGLGAVAMSWFEARLQIERTLAAEFLRTGAYCAVVLASAASGLGFWSFVAGQLAGQALFALELWRRARGEIVLFHAPGSTLGVVRDSLPLMGVWWLTTALAYSDAFVVGRLFEPRLLGLYGIGYSFAFLVFRVLQQPIARSLYPALVAYNEDPERQFRAYRLATLLFLALEVPAALLLAANADLVALVMRGEQYLGAAPYLALLAFAPLADPFGRFGGELLVARGLDRTRVASLVLQLAARVGGGVALSLWLGSPFGMAWANFLPLGAPVILFALVRAGAGRELRLLTRQLAGVFVVPLLPFAAAWLLAGDHRWLRLALTLVAAALALGWTWYRHGEDFRDFFRGPKAPGPTPAPHLEAQ